MEQKQTLTSQALQRMPHYLEFLKNLKQEGTTLISAPTVAAKFKISDVQVRKDLAAVSSIKGKPKQGFMIDDLIFNMETILGYHNTEDVVLVGAGRLGTTLLHYDGFDKKGFRIVAAFDKDSNKINSEENEVKILDINELRNFCTRMKIQIGIITVPKESAQLACDELVAAGVRAIYNFAPIHLEVPKMIYVENVDMVTSLIVLSKKIEGI